MTTQVPEGTPSATVDDVRRREAAHSAELAADGRLLRLWRPPLGPGEWRTLGLFQADDERAIEQTLVAMPLRIWRDDEVTPLSGHPNDPSPAPSPSGSPEFFTRFTIDIPAGTPPATVDEVWAHEARRARELAADGHLRRVWTLPDALGHPRTLVLWEAEGASEIAEIVDSLPVRRWATVATTPLSVHPSDPGRRTT